MSTLKGRNAHKGRTFGGVAACPHCSCPIRVHLVVARTQAVLDVVAASHLLPPYPADPGIAAGGCSAGGITPTARTAGAERPATSTVGAITSANAERVLFPGERGFDDDEDPVPPTQAQGHLGLR